MPRLKSIQFLKKDPNDRQAMILRARIEMQSGDQNELKAAMADLQEVLKQEPNSRAGLFFMADANFRSGQIDQARVYAGELDRNYPELSAREIDAGANRSGHRRHQGRAANHNAIAGSDRQSNARPRHLAADAGRPARQRSGGSWFRRVATSRH